MSDANIHTYLADALRNHWWGTLDDDIVRQAMTLADQAVGFLLSLPGITIDFSEANDESGQLQGTEPSAAANPRRG